MMSRGGAFYEPDLEIRRLEAELAAAEERATGLLAQRDEERGANFELRRELAAAKAQIESLLALHVCD